MRILISQQAPSKMTAYEALQGKFKAELTFRPFFRIEALTSREFRDQRVNLPDYTAIVFSSRHAIDAYFKLAEELRFKVPETMKYFCTTELVAIYLQKHIVFRKRKIFFGEGTPESLVALIGPKHKGEKFLIAKNAGSNSEALTSLLTKAGVDFTEAELVKSVTQDLKDLDISSYDIVALYNPADVKSLYENFPEFKQGKVKFAGWGKSIVPAMEDAGLSIDIQGPTPEAPSVARAIELYLQQNK
ncbi:MAG: uroporphyrinogen-III synthase [Bacteroidales bacterium]|jgi:uroporphyrinogen-III synthase|nr:uroporphyrinogen-III synthase [Bacteroidales bacterium]